MNGRKRIFSVVLKEGNPEIEARIKEKFPDLSHYKFNDTFFLVTGDGFSETIAESIGLKGEKRIEGASGVVFGLGVSYSGYTTRNLWEWLELAEERL